MTKPHWFIPPRFSRPLPVTVRYIHADCALNQYCPWPLYLLIMENTPTYITYYSVPVLCDIIGLLNCVHHIFFCDGDMWSLFVNSKSDVSSTSVVYVLSLIHFCNLLSIYENTTHSHCITESTHNHNCVNFKRHTYSINMKRTYSCIIVICH